MSEYARSLCADEEEYQDDRSEYMREEYHEEEEVKEDE
jgi:hypothetical protein